MTNYVSPTKVKINKCLQINIYVIQTGIIEMYIPVSLQ